MAHVLPSFMSNQIDINIIVLILHKKKYMNSITLLLLSSK